MPTNQHTTLSDCRVIDLPNVSPERIIKFAQAYPKNPASIMLIRFALNMKPNKVA